MAEVSQNKPEVMSPDQDKRYFQLDFRRAKGYSPEDKQCAQYWDICKAIWPEYASPEAFEQLDLRKSPIRSFPHICGRSFEEGPKTNRETRTSQATKLVRSTCLGCLRLWKMPWSKSTSASSPCLRLAA